MNEFFFDPMLPIIRRRPLATTFRVRSEPDGVAIEVPEEYNVAPDILASFSEEELKRAGELARQVFSAFTRAATAAVFGLQKAFAAAAETIPRERLTSEVLAEWMRTHKTRITADKLTVYTHDVLTEQHRFPRTKNRRIRRKWAARPENFRPRKQLYVVEKSGAIYCHPETAYKLCSTFMDTNELDSLRFHVKACRGCNGKIVKVVPVPEQDTSGIRLECETCHRRGPLALIDKTAGDSARDEATRRAFQEWNESALKC